MLEFSDGLPTSFCPYVKTAMSGTLTVQLKEVNTDDIQIGWSVPKQKDLKKAHPTVRSWTKTLCVLLKISGNKKNRMS